MELSSLLLNSAVQFAVLCVFGSLLVFTCGKKKGNPNSPLPPSKNAPPAKPGPPIDPKELARKKEKAERKKKRKEEEEASMKFAKEPSKKSSNVQPVSVQPAPVQPIPVQPVQQQQAESIAPEPPMAPVKPIKSVRQESSDNFKQVSNNKSVSKKDNGKLELSKLYSDVGKDEPNANVKYDSKKESSKKSESRKDGTNKSVSKKDESKKAESKKDASKKEDSDPDKEAPKSGSGMDIQKTQLMLVPDFPKELTLDPKELRFAASGGVIKLNLTNNTGNRVAVKIKCSDNELYRFNPVFSFVEKNGRVSVEVTRINAAAKPDKLAVVYTEANDDATDPQLAFQGVDSEKVNTLNVHMLVS